MVTQARLDDATKEYGERVRTRALVGVDLEISAGEITLLLGPSGSGKTTLLNLRPEAAMWRLGRDVSLPHVDASSRSRLDRFK